MLEKLSNTATVYIKKKSEFDSVGATDKLRGLAAKIKFTSGSLTQRDSFVNPEVSPVDKGSMSADRSTYMTARELLLQAMEDEELRKSEVYSPLLREYANRVKDLDKKYMQLEAAEHEYVGIF